MAFDDHGQSKVTVEKAELMQTLMQNREKHRTEYEESCEAYRKAVIAAAEQILLQAKEAREIDLRVIIDIATPTSYLKEYDKAISMLKMSVESQITLSENKFMQYVHDEWEWTGHFKAIAATYRGGHR